MKKLFILLLLFPFLSFSQSKNVVNSFKLIAKPDKSIEFEKGFAAHVKKYHNGPWKWRVYEIHTGPDAGAYLVTEGPYTWDEFDTRGSLGAAHTEDWNKNVEAYTTGVSFTSYNIFDVKNSTVKMTDYSDKIVINHINPKPGMVKGVNSLIEKMKRVWEISNESVAVYTAAVSGEPEVTYVTRLKAGLKELDESYRKPFSERYNAIYGEGAWDTFLADYAKFVEKRSSELLYYRADLSSK